MDFSGIDLSTNPSEKTVVILKGMNICLIQTDPSLGYKNLGVLSEILQTAKADIYVLPELFLTGFDTAVKKLAHRHGAFCSRACISANFWLATE